jgi:hypothetical protein
MLPSLIDRSSAFQRQRVAAHLLDHGYGAEESLAARQELTVGTLPVDGVHRAIYERSRASL